MLKFRTMFFSIIAAGILMSLSSATANAQRRPNPTDKQVAQARAQGPCRDPWVTIAIWDRVGSTRQPAGVGDRGECNAAMYNNGSWGSYDELYQGVNTALDNLSRAGGSISARRSGDRLTIITNLGEGFWTREVMKIMINNGGNLISNKGGGLISNDGSSLISNDGSSLIAAGGGNFRVQSTSTEKRVNLGKSVLIVTKHR